MLLIFAHRSRLPLGLAVALLGGCSASDDRGPECLNLPRPPARDVVEYVRVFPSVAIEGGVDLLLDPTGDRWYLATQSGQIYTFPNVAEPPAPTLFADLAPQIVEGGEAGLLGMAFHPDYADNGEVFLSYTGPGGPVFESRLSRFHTSDGLTLDLASEEPILVVDQPYTNHNGGDLGFGRDGFLYFGLGDGGSGGDPQNRAQDPDSLLGKLLRIDVDGGDPYAIPADNPYAAGGGRPEIFALGLRNPWRFNFDRMTGELWAGDVGQNVWEEIDKIVLGGNYGWNIKEGLDCFGQDACAGAGLVDPVAQYRNTGGASVIAGFVYRGAALPDLAGLFLYTDFYGETLWGVAEGAAPVVLSEAGVRGTVAFAEDQDGELYALAYGGGIYRLRAAAPRAALSSRTCSPRQAASTSPTRGARPPARSLMRSTSRSGPTAPTRPAGCSCRPAAPPRSRRTVTSRCLSAASSSRPSSWPARRSRPASSSTTATATGPATATPGTRTAATRACSPAARRASSASRRGSSPTAPIACTAIRAPPAAPSASSWPSSRARSPATRASRSISCSCSPRRASSPIRPPPYRCLRSPATPRWPSAPAPICTPTARSATAPTPPAAAPASTCAATSRPRR
ncbi:PQQ-dependent sugar dehydrogenase [Nannocystis pusilla]|uniref:PQQ-dependent sugar dehydrogenase n=1 Tax=Nannocystis pusilla TaxID=889268 RepID=A0A9X3ETR3_9BACT|nr:PQQ-dependent sugar dehydrogenase [Nannocystis pusilla]MCY1005328.1 PQQ-dependent sugar dehydrogenase [Nannocystis pusilla]